MTQKKGKLIISHRYNQTPLLYSYPGGFNGSWSYKTYPNAKVQLFSQLPNDFKKSSIFVFYNIINVNTTIILFYTLIVVGIVGWIVLLPGKRLLSDKTVANISVFGGAFLFASCFINLVPHLYLEGFETPRFHIKVGAAVLVGYFIQLVLEHVTGGVEHGHNHCHECEEHRHAMHPVTGLLIGLSIHSFLEGMPLIDPDGDIHQGLLYGIVLHNIPITLVLLGLFINNGYSFRRSLLLLLIFAVMTPLGSLCNLYLLPDNEVLQSLLMGLVVGILLHVSVSILFDHDHNLFSWKKILLILIAFIAAYYTPGCPEIYPVH